MRLATYATHWIRVRVQQFVLSNRSMVRAPATRGARKVLGRIGRARRVLASRSCEPSAEELAREIGVTPADVESVLLGQRADIAMDTADDAGSCAVSTSSDPEERYADAELARARRHTIDGALATLPARERNVVESRTLAEDAETLEQLARKLCLSRERVRQLEARALRHIGEALSHEGLAA